MGSEIPGARPHSPETLAFSIALSGPAQEKNTDQQEKAQQQRNRNAERLSQCKMDHRFRRSGRTVKTRNDRAGATPIGETSNDRLANAVSLYLSGALHGSHLADQLVLLSELADSSAELTCSLSGLSHLCDALAFAGHRVEVDPEFLSSLLAFVFGVDFALMSDVISPEVEIVPGYSGRFMLTAHMFLWLACGSNDGMVCIDSQSLGTALSNREIVHCVVDGNHYQWYLTPSNYDSVIEDALIMPRRMVEDVPSPYVVLAHLEMLAGLGRL